ncbi:MAG: hypothetical protein QOI58_1551 [Thermoanaerobaculia bacterium]|jgi:outer membrane murein-binding lipoprotein Lpp|nr:hypothetical protein [Thermoanaerobaculia bacterium]
MTSTARSIIIALISALATITAAIIMAGNAAERKTESTINEAGGEIKTLRDEVATLRTDLDRARTAIATAVQSFPQSISKGNVALLRTFEDEYHAPSPASRQLLNITGRGTIVSGAILGFYFKDSPGGANYVVSIVLDGVPFKYPAVSQRAYAQNRDGANTGVLMLPPIRYTESLRITYAYPGGDRYISAYAVVLPE